MIFNIKSGNTKIIELKLFTADNKEERIITAALAESGWILIGIGEVVGSLECQRLLFIFWS